MKAGAFTPAIQFRVGIPVWHRQARSMKAGAFTPAIRGDSRLQRWLAPEALNEGGGLHPRNPRVQDGSIASAIADRRSMKAGAFTPAIRARSRCGHLATRPRSMKAGAFTPAIPVAGIGSDDSRQTRSMKAGAFTPAIPNPAGGAASATIAQ